MKKDQLASAYRLISELFLYPEDRDTELIEVELAKLESALKIRAAIEDFLVVPASASVEEYIATLELEPLVPLYLGSYLFEEPNSCRGAGMSGRNGYMLELNNIYRHFGFEFTGREMADFAPVVVEFLSLSLERMELDQIGLRRYLVETHLIDGIDSLLTAMRKAESPYERLVDALRLALDEDLEQMSDGPLWQQPVEDLRPGEQIRTSTQSTTVFDAFENGAEL